MLNNFAIDSISEQSLGMWYLAIFMTPHYDLKQQEKNNGVLGAGGGVTNIFVIYLGGGGSSMFFQRDWGGGGRQNVCLPHENVTGPPT